MGSRTAGRHSRANDAQLGTCIVDRSAGREATEDRDPRARSGFECRAVHAQRHPETVIFRERECVGHDANDRRGFGAHLHARAQDAGGAVETCLPHAFTDDDHRRFTRVLIAIQQRSTEQRRRSHQPERIGRHLRSANRLHAAVFGGEVADKRVRRTDVFDGLELRAPGREILQGARFDLRPLPVPIDERHDTVAAGNVEPRMQELVDCLEVRRT